MHVGTPEAIAAAEAAMPRQHELERPMRASSVYDSPDAEPPCANVFTIPASAPFLPTLIEALRAGKLVPAFRPRAIRWRWRARRFICRRGAPAGWRATSSSTSSKTTPRSCRASSPLGDIDEDEIAFAEAATGELRRTRSTLPPALDALERRLLLARARSLKWANVAAVRGEQGAPLIANTPAAALALADDLARLMDDMTTRQVPGNGSTSWCRTSSTATGRSRSNS